jgi:hypothetical protein
MNIRIAFFRLLTVLLLCVSCFGKTDELRSVVSQSFPKAVGLGSACWVVPEEGEGYLSEIVVFQVDDDGRARVLWQSDLDPAYSPQIRFAEEILVSGVPIALVERQNGAATSQLDIIGKVSGRFQRLNQIDGFKFEVEHLDGSKLPLIIAHTVGNILDIPVIYRWNGSRFVEDSASHPAYYQQLLSEDKAKLPPDSSEIVSVNLSRIALLSGNRPEARTILDDALSRERQKGEGANKETLRSITEALRGLGPESRQ